MPEITIYTGRACGYCVMAKRLLDSKSATYTEINIDSQSGLREEIMQKTGRRTVPQIFIGERHIGGFDDMYALDKQGLLDPLLKD